MIECPEYRALFSACKYLTVKRRLLDSSYACTNSLRRGTSGARDFRDSWQTGSVVDNAEGAEQKDECADLGGWDASRSTLDKGWPNPWTPQPRTRTHTGRNSCSTGRKPRYFERKGILETIGSDDSTRDWFHFRSGINSLWLLYILWFSEYNASIIGITCSLTPPPSYISRYRLIDRKDRIARMSNVNES